MSKPSYIYITADENRTLDVLVAKDPDVALAMDQERAGKPLKIVYFEEHPTILHAHERAEELSRRSKRQLAKLICKHNPKWRNLVPCAEWVGTAGGAIDDLYRRIDAFERRLIALGRQRRDFGDDDFGQASGGVFARIPVGPRGPRESSDARELPFSDDE